MGATGTEGADPDTIGAVGEFALVAMVVARLPVGDGVDLGPGDDAAVVRAPDGRVVATTDVLVEERHFRRAWSSGYDVGRRAAAQNLADVAAMGAVPTALLVGIVVPGDLPAQWALDLADGLRDESDLVGASVVGGDVTRGDKIVVAVTALGDLGGRAPVTRGGAMPGDVVAVCGRLGWSEAGRAVLSRGFRSPRVVVSAYQRPEPPYDAGPEAALLGATAMIDVSDGLLQDLGHVAVASGVQIDLDGEAFGLEQPLRDVGAALGVDPTTFVLAGGEDHALVACFPPRVALPERWHMVGQVGARADPSDATAPAVTVDGAAWHGATGWDHFR
jgi:thiamine-monophosphate kinase